MRRPKLNTIFNAAAILPAILGMSSAVFMAYVFWWPPKAAFEVANPGAHSISHDADTITIHREYCINYPMPITITRDMVKVVADGDAELRVSLPTTTQVYNVGCHKLDRILELPRRLPDGKYRLAFTASWDANPFRQESVKYPDLYITVQNKK